MACVRWLRAMPISAHYLGGVWERDGGYHQGPVWGWLLGHYALAEYRVRGDAAAAQPGWSRSAITCWMPAWARSAKFSTARRRTAPRGAPAQAWSVACMLEAWQRLERLRCYPAPRPGAGV
jgi:glycogen debranching enzyme